MDYIYNYEIENDNLNYDQRIENLRRKNENILIQIKNLKKINNDIFNIGGGMKNAISLKNLTLKCEKITGNRLAFKKIKKTSIFDIPYYVTDNSKVKKIYKWKPSRNIDKILNDIYIWLIKNKYLKNYF